MLTQCIYNVYKMPKTKIYPQGSDNVYTSLYKLANDNI